MKLMSRFPFLAVFFVLAIFLLCPLNTNAAQTFHGDGATNNGSGGWTAGAAAPGQCLACHIAGGLARDESSYLMTGHKNMLRKVTPGKPWAGVDGTTYQTTDDLYGSGSIYDWIAGTVNVAGNGTIKLLFYIFGGWMDRAQLNTAFDGGFTGEQYPNGNYMCARCHVTGYRFDASGPEPTTYLGTPITDAQFSRIPTDFTTGTSSWSLDGIQCERCHNADNVTNNHTASGLIAGGIPTKPILEQGTALCIECHRQEAADTTANTITLSTDLAVSDGGSCSDGVSPDYTTCVSIPGNTWNYAPFFDADKGQSFLSSPHARFTGSLTQTAQNSPDLSVSMSGAYNSAFKDLSTGFNKGCTGCHDPHQSTIESVGAKPFVKNCNDCHALAQNLLQTGHHPQGPGTPFPTRTTADIPKSCAVCHMVSGSGYHFMRINVDPNYSTFPTAAQLYAGQTTANTASDGKLLNAVWVDVDLACGQCHVGSGSIGITTPSPGAPVLDKSRLAAFAKNIHGQDTYTITASVSGSGSITPSGTVTVTSGGSQSVSIAPAAGYVIVNVVVDGATVGAVSSYTFNNVTANHTISATFAQQLTITASAGPNGTITPSGNVSLLSGANKTFTFTPAAGYRVLNVVVDGVSYGARSSWFFSKVTANHTITVSFTPDVYTITATVVNSGTITPAAVTTVNKGDNLTYTITPGAGYKILNVWVDGSSKGGITTYSFTNVTANHMIKAYFVTQ